VTRRALSAVLLATVLLLTAAPSYASNARGVRAPPFPPPAQKCEPPEVSSPPDSRPSSVPPNGAANLSVKVSGTNPSVTWYDDSDQMVGAGNSIMVSPKSTTCYYAVVRNSCQRNGATSSPVCVAVSDEGKSEK
jgi:hypothetical protein